MYLKIYFKIKVLQNLWPYNAHLPFMLEKINSKEVYFSNMEYIYIYIYIYKVYVWYY